MIELTPIEESVAGKQLIEMGVEIGELIGGIVVSTCYGMKTLRAPR